MEADDPKVLNSKDGTEDGTSVKKERTPAEPFALEF